MSMDKITQTEARRLKRRVKELEDVLQAERRRYGSEWPGGTVIAEQAFESSRNFVPAVVTVARSLGHAVVVAVSSNRVIYRALPHPQVTP